MTDSSQIEEEKLCKETVKQNAKSKARPEESEYFSRATASFSHNLINYPSTDRE